MTNQKQFYSAALYLRLSSQNLKDNSMESDSIVNQEALIRSALKAYPEIQIKHIFKDDGWSGVNFNRPGFQKMMQKIYDNEVDCVIVKDLSRLGRNHTETGKYITRVFPAFGVRFIAVNDHIDTESPNTDTDSIIIPFKDLLNDSYSRDLSMKVRSVKAVKNAAGEFEGAFHPYGYEIDSTNKNHYVIDKEAAMIVRKIYSWTFDGVGSTEIVRRLEKMKVLCPSEYKKKKAQGDKYIKGKTKWNIYQIYRILRNDVYMGILRLGKTTSPNYKIKKQMAVPEENQYVFENAHEPIIRREEFILMQELLSRDSRVYGRIGSNTHIYPLTGYVFCKDCGANMIIKSVTSKGKLYRYYTCGENRRDKKVCAPHNIPFERVNDVVLKALNKFIKILVEIDETFTDNEMQMFAQPDIEKIQIQIGKILEEKYEVADFIKGLYRDYKDGILTESEYFDLKAEYQEKMDELSNAAAELELKKESQVDEVLGNMYWIRKYREHGELTELTRRDVAVFIERVEIKDLDHISIKFRFGDEYKKILKGYKKFLKEAQ